METDFLTQKQSEGDTGFVPNGQRFEDEEEEKERDFTEGPFLTVPSLNRKRKPNPHPETTTGIIGKQEEKESSFFFFRNSTVGNFNANDDVRRDAWSDDGDTNDDANSDVIRPWEENDAPKSSLIGIRLTSSTSLPSMQISKENLEKENRVREKKSTPQMDWNEGDQDTKDYAKRRAGDQLPSLRASGLSLGVTSSTLSSEFQLDYEEEMQLRQQLTGCHGDDAQMLTAADYHGDVMGTLMKDVTAEHKHDEPPEGRAGSRVVPLAVSFAVGVNLGAAVVLLGLYLMGIF